MTDRKDILLALHEKREKLVEQVTKELFDEMPHVQRAIAMHLDLPIQDIVWSDVVVEEEADTIVVQIMYQKLAGQDIILMVPLLYHFSLDDVLQDDADLLLQHIRDVDNSGEMDIVNRVMEQIQRGFEDSDDIIEQFEVDNDTTPKVIH